jgi:hypothetical protein
MATHSLSDKKQFCHKYDFALGIDFHDKNMPREFQNTKSVLKRHLESQLHLLTCEWKKAQLENSIFAKKASFSAGLALSRIVYSNLYRGLPLHNYTCDVLVAAKNGCNCGDINHSVRFAQEFRKNCAKVLLTKLRHRLDTLADCTGQPLPVVVSVRKKSWSNYSD